MIEIKVDKDPHIRIPEDQDVRIVYTKSFFEKKGLFKWISEFKLGTAEEAFKFWAQRLRTRLDEFHAGK